MFGLAFWWDSWNNRIRTGLQLLAVGEVVKDSFRSCWRSLQLPGCGCADHVAPIASGAVTCVEPVYPNIPHGSDPGVPSHPAPRCLSNGKPESTITAEDTGGLGNARRVVPKKR